MNKTTRRKVFKRDNNRCLNCGSDVDLTVDHILPKAKGGTDDMENLQTLCLTCNSVKGCRLINRGSPIKLQFGSISLLHKNFLTTNEG